jgi:hypothetical protein
VFGQVGIKALVFAWYDCFVDEDTEERKKIKKEKK